VCPTCGNRGSRDEEEGGVGWNKLSYRTQIIQQFGPGQRALKSDLAFPACIYSSLIS
jgi:hypothetical protein